MRCCLWGRPSGCCEILVRAPPHLLARCSQVPIYISVLAVLNFKPGKFGQQPINHAIRPAV